MKEPVIARSEWRCVARSRGARRACPPGAPTRERIKKTGAGRAGGAPSHFLSSRAQKKKKYTNALHRPHPPHRGPVFR